MDHRKHVTHLGIPFWPEHAHETLARYVEDLGEFLEPHRRVDIVTQHCLAGIDVTGEQSFDSFLQQSLTERGVPLGACLNGVLKIFVTAIGFDPSIFAFNGFGTLGVAHSNEGQADFVSGSLKPKGAGYSDDWSLAVDSRIAGQITANFTPTLSAVVKGIVEQNYDNSYSPRTEWANIKYQFTPDFDVRVGRTVLPIFLVSDYRKVGYVNPWVRPPVELYVLICSSN